jgi:signal transduction histidine kinase
MQDLSLHILDIIENSVNAGSTRVEVRILENASADLLTLKIRDNGRGMDAETARKALDPFYTTKPGKRVGLGIPLLAQAAREGGGALALDARPGRGISMTATFKISHPDLKPMGDIEGTMRMLRITHPDIEFIYDYVRKQDQPKGESS